jgi:hypothetical protein
MKQQKLLLIGLVVVAFVAFFMMRPVREKLCPLRDVTQDADFILKCDELNGTVVDGQCVCSG